MPARLAHQQTSDPVTLALELKGPEIVGTVDGALTLRAIDTGDAPFADGGVGLVITEGALSTDEVEVSPLQAAAARAAA